MAYLQADYHKNDGSSNDTQTRYSLADDALFPDEMAAQFNGLSSSQKLSSSTSTQPPVPLHFIGWQKIPAIINVVASAHESDYLPIAGNYGRQTLTISPRGGVSGTPYQVTVLRNKNSYPSTASGLASLKAAVQAGMFELTIVGTGQKIAAGNVPPTTVTPGDVSTNPVGDAPAALGGLRLSYDGTKLRIENTGGVKTIAFRTNPDVPFSINNPSGVLIESNKPYGYGTTSDPVWSRQWEINHQPASFYLTLTLEAGGTYSMGITPPVGAVNAVLIGAPSTNPSSGSGSSLPTLGKVLMIGNSFLYHPAVGRGLGSTALEKDYKHLLISKLKTLNSAVQVYDFNDFASAPFTKAPGDIGGNTKKLSNDDNSYWEQHYWELTTAGPAYLYYNMYARWQPVADWSPDLLILQLGENIGDPSHDLAGAYRTMVNFFKAVNPALKVIISTSSWGNNGQDDVARLLAQQESWTLVDREGIPNPHGGDQQHPDDSGHAALAERFYAPIPGLFSAGASAPTTGSNVISWADLLRFVMVSGNSIVRTTFQDAVTGQTYDNGMAAHGPQYDLLHLLRARCKANYAQSNVWAFQDCADNGLVPPQPPTSYAFPYGVGDGPHWESNYWKWNDDPYADQWYGFLDRYTPIASAKPSLFIMRLVENVPNEDHGFEAAYEAYVKKFISQNSSAKVICTTSFWDESWKDTIIKRVAGRNGWYVCDFEGIAGARAGEGQHPNNAAHAEADVRLWATIMAIAGSATTGGSANGSGGSSGNAGGNQGSGGSSSTLYNKPNFETYAYPVISGTTVWPDYDSRVVAAPLNRVIGEKCVLENDYIRIEVWKNYGCAVAHFSKKGTLVNLINQNRDLGRGASLTFYLGGTVVQNPPKQIGDWGNGKSVEEDQSHAGVGYNPIQIGDYFNYPSQVLAFVFDGKTIYTKTQLVNWNVKNDLTDLVLEQWIFLDGRACKVYHRTSFNRVSEKQQYDARSNEFPNFYTIGDLPYLAYVDGNGSVQYKTGGNGQKFTIRENWIAAVPRPGAEGVGLHRPGLFTTNQDSDNGTSGTEFSNGTNHANAPQHLQFDWNGVLWGNYSLVFGTPDQIRQYALAQPDNYNKVGWKFNNRNGRGRFWFHNLKDTGFPTPNTGMVLSPKIVGNTELNWPEFSLSPASFSTVYLRYIATGNVTSATLFFGKTGQTDQEIAHQGVDVSFVNDGQARTVSVNLGNFDATYQTNVDGVIYDHHVVWNDGIPIAKLVLQFHNASADSQLTLMWVNSVNADPEP